KIESGQIEVTRGEMNINEQLDYIYSFFKPEVDKNEITLKCIKPIEDSKAFNFTDSEKIYAILINLIKNAIKYSQGNSIEFGYNKIDGFIEYFVKDNGIGIPREKQNIIFDRFTQVESISKIRNEGAGLGLAISKAYVEILEGKIWLESEEKKGTSFFFTIPFMNESINNQ
ncbi:MAG: PAS domain-containing sensor histidine kinase, partial [Bacteroidetes bacterium HGW-Bacteroidetes-15]